MIDLCRGIVRIEPIRIRYSFDLQEAADGRRRWRLRLNDKRLARSDAVRDPALDAVREWIAGGDIPPQAVVGRPDAPVTHHALQAMRI